jgi:hypothetical protein
MGLFSIVLSAFLYEQEKAVTDFKAEVSGIATTLTRSELTSDM